MDFILTARPDGPAGRVIEAASDAAAIAMARQTEHYLHDARWNLLARRTSARAWELTEAGRDTGPGEASPAPDARRDPGPAPRGPDRGVRRPSRFGRRRRVALSALRRPYRRPPRAVRPVRPRRDAAAADRLPVRRRRRRRTGWSRPSWRARFKHRPAAHAMAPPSVALGGPRWRRSQIAAYALVFGEVHGARGADTDRLYRDAGRADIEVCHAIADAIAKAAAVKAAKAARRTVTKETKP